MKINLKAIHSQTFLVAYFTLALMPVLTGADAYLYRNGLLPKLPSIFLLLLLFVPVFFKDFLLTKGAILVNSLSKTSLVSIPFGVLAMVSLIWGVFHPDSNWARGGRIVYLDFLNWSILILAIGIGCASTLRKHCQLIFLLVLAGAWMGVWFDVVNPGVLINKPHQAHRAAGFMGNANEGASSIVFLTIAAVNWQRKTLLNWAIFLISGLTIYPTLSFGGLGLFFGTVFIYILLYLKEEGTLLKVLTIFVVIPLMAIFVVKPLTNQIIQKNEQFEVNSAKERRETLANMSEGDMTFAKDHSRVRLLILYWEVIKEKPLWGRGTGNSRTDKGKLEAHNIYLKHWAENGIIGLFALLLLLGGTFYHFKILKNLKGMVFAFVLIPQGFYSDDMWGVRTIVILLGLLATIAYFDYLDQRNQQSANP